MVHYNDASLVGTISTTFTSSTTYIAQMNTSVASDSLTTYDENKTSNDTFDVKLSVDAIAGSASYLSSNIIFFVNNGLDADNTTVTNMSVTDVLYMVTTSTTDFSDMIFGTTGANFSDSFIDSAATTISNSEDKTIVEEFIDRLADSYFSHYKASSLFTNTSLVSDKLNGDKSNSGSLLYALNTNFSNLNSSGIQSYNDIVSIPAGMAITLLETQLDNNVGRFEDGNLVPLTSENNATAYAALQTYNQTNETSYIGYFLPIRANDEITLPLSITVNPDQNTVIANSDATQFSELKTLFAVTLK